MSTMRNREVFEKIVSNKSRYRARVPQRVGHFKVIDSPQEIIHWSRVFTFFGQGFLISALGHHRLQGWTCETAERACECLLGVWLQGGALLPSAVSRLAESLQAKLRICALRSDRVEQTNWKGYSYILYNLHNEWMLTNQPRQKSRKWHLFSILQPTL